MKKIKIDHIARIEGHMGFIGHIMANNITKARLEVLEGARLIEGLLLDRNYDEAPIITSRICGLCPTIHNITSIKAMEAALNIKPDENTKTLRKILLLAQIIQGHALHFFFLSAGDFLGIKNDLELIKRYPDLSKKTILIRDFANRLIEIIAGRAIHPLTPCVGGFRKLPDQKNLNKLMQNYNDILLSSSELTRFFAQLDYTNFSRETEYIALSNPDEYAIYNGDIKTSARKLIPESEFIKDVREIQKPYAVVKRSEYHGEPFMVGALARINLNQNKLNNLSKRLIAESPIRFPSFNSMHNVFAQTIETVHAIEEIKILLEKINFKKIILNPKIKLHAGKGVGVAEAPRGTLYHSYELDNKGKILNADVITPTAQFLANLEEDLKVLLGKTHDKAKIKTLIRAYDPCISCATH
ncbi:hypothetical protein CL633_00765 [bacterium]|nr:hypothetical protein [bacterium]|tara:strand:- start:1532 stop:2770 length:1239 start_codon:yes stop_codon:yes gene_type:complete